VNGVTPCELFIGHNKGPAMSLASTSIAWGLARSPHYFRR
jgi:hypothetical protein